MVSHPLIMDQSRFNRWTQQLCGSGMLDLGAIGEHRADFLTALDDLGLTASIDGSMLRLSERIETLDIDSLQSNLTQRGLASACQYRLQTQSTNLDVLGLFDQEAQVSIATCEKQTHGKGRRGNQWLSPFGQNIYCTVGLLKTIKPIHLGLLSIVTGLAIGKALASLGYDGIQLKWPNDLLHQGKKLGGILIESRPVTNNQYFLAIGFGINVDMSDAQLATIEQAVTCLNRIASQVATRNQILLETVSQILRDIDAFNDECIPQIVSDFDTMDAFRGRQVNAVSSGRTVSGVNAGIDPTGQLQLDTAQGVALFSAADISLRSA